MEQNIISHISIFVNICYTNSILTLFSNMSIDNIKILVLVFVEDCGEEVVIWIVNYTLQDFKGKLILSVEEACGEKGFIQEMSIEASLNHATKLKMFSKKKLELNDKNTVLYTVAVTNNNIVENDTVYFDAFPKDLKNMSSSSKSHYL